MLLIYLCVWKFKFPPAQFSFNLMDSPQHSWKRRSADKFSKLLFVSHCFISLLFLKMDLPGIQFQNKGAFFLFLKNLNLCFYCAWSILTLLFSFVLCTQPIFFSLDIFKIFLLWLDHDMLWYGTLYFYSAWSYWASLTYWGSLSPGEYHD